MFEKHLWKSDSLSKDASHRFLPEILIIEESGNLISPQPQLATPTLEWLS